MAFVTAFVLLASAVGLASQAILTRSFGAGPSIDAFVLATSAGLGLANLVGSSIGAVAQRRLISGRRSAHDGLESLLPAVLLASGTVFFGGLLWSLFMRSRSGEVFTSILAITAPFAFLAGSLYVVSRFLVAAHGAGGSFVAPAAAGVLPQAGTLLGVVVASWAHDVVLAAFGLLVGTLAYVVVLLPGMPIRISQVTVRRSLDSARAIYGPAVVVAIAALPSALSPLIEGFYGARIGPGAITYLGLSERFVGLLSVALGYGVGTVSYTELAASHSRGDHFRTRALATTRLRGLAFFGVGALCVGLVVRGPALSVIFLSGQFGPDSIEQLSSVLPGYLVGGLALAALNLLSRVFYAVGNFRAPAVIGVVVPATFFAVGSWLVHAGVTGLSLAFGLSWLAGLSLAVAMLWRGALLAIDGLGAFALRISACGLVGALGAMAVQLPIPAGLGQVTFGAIVGLGLYWCCARYVLDLPEAMLLVRSPFARTV